MKTDTITHGFRLLEERKISEINSISRLFRHEKSGARLLHLENDDDNKLFCIAFRTLPEDNSGLMHILEHSVLCGSRKFPTKEPFVDLAKGSLKTFLNAFTSSDSTMYPVASMNEKDFFNLMNVYLDAVLFPRLHEAPEIFMQEGWHYELENRDDELTYKGVVYNEMKGAYSSPDGVMMRSIKGTLFPDTVYQYDAGGNPEAIPDLTYSRFAAYHRKYYHPSNSYVFLYGNGDMEKQLRFLDEEYLRLFDQVDIDSAVKGQKPYDEPREKVMEYSISTGEDEKDKTYLALSFAIGKSTDPEQYLAFGILEHLLLETPASPLKKALIDAGIGKDVFGIWDNSKLHSFLSVIVKNSNPDARDKFQETVFETLNDLVKNGIDKRQIEASINIWEFELREADSRGFPKGFFIHRKVMNSWLYDGDPTIHLRYEPRLEKIKSALTTDYFERLIEKHLLNNNHRSMLIFKPQQGLDEEKAGELKKKLAGYKAGLSDDELDYIIEQTKTLRKLQQKPDSPEDVAKIPLLSLSDINPKAETLPLVEQEIGGVKLLTHPMFTNRIGYLNLFFDSDAVQESMIPYIPLLARVLGEMGTEKYDHGELSNEINIHTGGIEASAEKFVDKDGDTRFFPKLVVSSKALTDKLPELAAILGEVLCRTGLDDRKRLKEIVNETKSRLEMVINMFGHIFALHRCSAYFSHLGKYQELINGLSYYKFIADIEKNFDKKADEVIENLQKTAEAVFNRNNLVVSFTADETDFIKLLGQLPVLLNQLDDETPQKQIYKLDFLPGNEGLLVPSMVQFVAKAYNYRRLGQDYNGHMNVLEQIVGKDYLWNKVRVQGGAYGTQMNFNRSGNLFFSSFRDPNLKETIDVFDGTADFIRDFRVSEREMSKYIIGSIGSLDSPLTPSMKGEKAAANYFSNITQDDIQQERDEVLATTTEDIRKMADMIGEAMKKNYMAVLGSEVKIRENGGLFSRLVKVFE
ncbi:insulinase family protein [bacterium]|nr:insulinase family protein [bacterium]